jgi:hypothetical protein
MTDPADIPIVVEVRAPALGGDAPVQVVTRAGLPGRDGPATVHISLADYLALPPEEQLDGTWYITPKTS